MTEQRKIFLKEFRFFMNNSEIEQTLRLRGSVVTMDEFWRYPLGTSAVRVVLAINQFGPILSKFAEYLQCLSDAPTGTATALTSPRT
jgi:hypothetical protein